MKKKLQLNKETMTILNMNEMVKVVGGLLGECPSENADVDILLPDSEDCSVFYKCDWGVPVLFNCPDDLLFSVEAGKCDHPDRVNCARKPSVPGTSVGNGTCNTTMKRSCMPLTICF